MKERRNKWNGLEFLGGHDGVSTQGDDDDDDDDDDDVTVITSQGLSPKCLPTVTATGTQPYTYDMTTPRSGPTERFLRLERLLRQAPLLRDLWALHVLSGPGEPSGGRSGRTAGGSREKIGRSPFGMKIWIRIL